MGSKHFDIQKVLEHIKNLEQELGFLKELVGVTLETQEGGNEARIQKLREQLIDEGLDKELVRLVGTVPLHRDSYKEEIRTVIYERYQRKL